MNTRTKRTICRTVGALALLAMILLVGGTEMGWMPLGRGIALAVACELLGAALLWKGGVVQIG